MDLRPQQTLNTSNPWLNLIMLLESYSITEIAKIHFLFLSRNPLIWEKTFWSWDKSSFAGWYLSNKGFAGFFPSYVNNILNTISFRPRKMSQSRCVFNFIQPKFLDPDGRDIPFGRIKELFLKLANKLICILDEHCLFLQINMASDILQIDCATLTKFTLWHASTLAVLITKQSKALLKRLRLYKSEILLWQTTCNWTGNILRREYGKNPQNLDTPKIWGKNTPNLKKVALS